MRARFAPSPTGQLHLGHAYAAFFAYDLALKKGGEFLLRFEDIDTTRTRECYYSAIEEDLLWLGIQWQEKALRQTSRMPAYLGALGKLKSLDVLYPCFCTRRKIQKEIEGMTNAPHGPEGVLYPRTCRSLSSTEQEARIGSGEAHCWRLDSSHAAQITGDLIISDGFKGMLPVNSSLLGDAILARKDIATSYHLAVVVDDFHQKITDITRGEDLLLSTHLHRTLQELLGLPAPNYHHHHLILDINGKRLAKRDDATSIRSLRERGKSPKEIRAMCL